MKKNLALITAMLCLTAGFTACDDTENHAEATTTYYVGTDSISYSDPLNAEYDSLIINAFDSLGFTSYYFEEHAEVEMGVIANAIAICNSKADKKYLNSMASPVTLQQVATQLYKDNTELFNTKGINTPADINLKPMTIHTFLWCDSYNSYLNKKSVPIN